MRKPVFAILCFSWIMMVPTPAYAMHIAEGILPPLWAGIWYIAAIPFLIVAIAQIKKRTKSETAYVPLIAMVSAVVFIVSAMPIPIPFAGTCSHPSGMGLAAILIGPFPAIAAASISLLLQALFMAHGGITTYGANLFSMGVVGALTGYAVFRSMLRISSGSVIIAAFAAGLIADWATYACTSFQLALALKGTQSFSTLLVSIIIAFSPAQIPIGLLEGFACSGLLSFMLRRRPDIVSRIGVKSGSHSYG